MSELLNIDVLKNAITNMGQNPKNDSVFQDDFVILTRSLVLYRFIKKVT